MSLPKNNFGVYFRGICYAIVAPKLHFIKWYYWKACVHWPQQWTASVFAWSCVIVNKSISCEVSHCPFARCAPVLAHTLLLQKCQFVIQPRDYNGENGPPMLSWWHTLPHNFWYHFHLVVSVSAKLWLGRIQFAEAPQGINEVLVEHEWCQQAIVHQSFCYLLRCTIIPQTRVGQNQTVESWVVLLNKFGNCGHISYSIIAGRNSRVLFWKSPWSTQAVPTSIRLDCLSPILSLLFRSLT